MSSDYYPPGVSGNEPQIAGEPEHERPAFPSVIAHCARPGMTMREWYAGQALAGIIVARVCTGIGMPEASEGFNRLPEAESAAQAAFAYADAMLAEAAK